jgi:ADP-ribosylglycohydrolase/protein-tyrosine phosphatase
VRADRSAGAVLASAVGDALGAPYEFGPPVASAVPVRMTGGGAFGWDPGEWTDDTQMALAILTALARHDTARDPLPAIEQGFRTWYRSGPSDVGTQTRQVLGTPPPTGLAAAARAYVARRPDRAAGNGSLMRTGPVALAHPNDPVRIASLARSVSELTHADTDCVDACVLWSVAIDHAIHHAPVEVDGGHSPYDWAGALIAAVPHLPDQGGRRARWRQLIDQAVDPTVVPADFPTNGWVVHAFQAALNAIVTTPVPAGVGAPAHLDLALANAVRAGGDTDTVAAIAGSLLGARWGATAVRLGHRRLLHGRRIYGEAVLVADDLDMLARLAANHGRPLADGWPGAVHLVGHYEAAGLVDRPRQVTLGGIGFGNVLAVRDAVVEGADVVVSLCRMGSADVPADVEHHVLGLLDTTPEENPNVVHLLADLVDTLAEMVDEGRRPFVHCVAAANRTPTVAAAWLHRHNGLSPSDALALASARLRRPDKAFLEQAVRALSEIPRR